MGVVPVCGMGVYWEETREGMGGIVAFWFLNLSFASYVKTCELATEVGWGVEGVGKEEYFDPRWRLLSSRRLLCVS